MSGGTSFWRWRLCAGVSPVRVSMRDRQADFADRLAEVALDVDGQRLERRNIERVDAAMRLARVCASAASARSVERRQEAGQRLAGAGRRDQQHRLPSLRARQQIDLMGARRPAATPRTI